jgi:hypothetical protein
MNPTKNQGWTQVLSGRVSSWLHSVGAMEAINVTPIQLLVFSSLIVAVDPVAVSISILMLP